MARLENWSTIIGDEATPYMAPEQISQRLHGIVYDHPSGRPGCADGTEVVTTRIIEFDPVNKRAVTKSGTVYQLGKIDPVFVKFLRDEKRTRSLEMLAPWLEP